MLFINRRDYTFPYYEWSMIFFMASLVALLALFTDRSLVVGNLMTIGHETAVVGLIALGVLVVFYVNEYDLSVGSMFALCLMLVSFAEGAMPSFLAWLLVMGLVGVIGYVNGLITVTLSAGLLITFTMMFALRGLVYLLSNGIYVTHELWAEGTFMHALGWGVIFGVPVAIFVFWGFVVLLEVFFRRTSSGRCVRAIGLDSVAVMECGVKISPYKIGAFVFAALMAGIACILYYTRLHTVSPNVGLGFPFEALAIVIISHGGVHRLQPSPFRVLVVTFLLVWIQDYVELLGLMPGASYLVTGCLVLLVLLLDHFRSLEARQESKKILGEDLL